MRARSLTLAKAKRVHNLAKELGVDSKAILTKCQAEGLEMKNHMSTVSVGLEMTIREWFSEDHAGGTAVETAEKVDLTKVRKAKARKKAKPVEPEAPAEAKEIDEAAEAPVEAAPPAARSRSPSRSRSRTSPRPRASRAPTSSRSCSCRA
jgi:translation initiation factor IF-2